MLRTTWVYSLKKEDLTSYLSQFEQSVGGTVDDLRKRFAKFLTSEHEAEVTERLLHIQAKHENNAATSPHVRLQVAGCGPGSDGQSLLTSPRKTESTSAAIEAQGSPPVIENRGAILAEVRKWGLKYDGRKTPLEFIERVEDLAEMSEIDLNRLLKVLPELLCDRALSWLRNHHKQWEWWQDFKHDFYNFFLPHRYFEKLDDEIRKRTQRPREPFKDYVLAIQDLMRRTNMSLEQKIERIYRNSHADYQWYIRRKDFTTLDELITLASDLENIPTSVNSGRGEHHRMVQNAPPPPADQNDRACSPLPPESIAPGTRIAWEKGKIRAEIIIENQPVTALIDTGATRSVIMPEFMHKFARPLHCVPADMTVLLADGSRKSVSRVVKCRVKFGNVSAHHDFLVMDDAAEDLVLGLDFLQEFNTTLTCAGLEAESSPATTPPWGRSATDVSLFPECVDNDPAGSQQVVPKTPVRGCLSSRSSQGSHAAAVAGPSAIAREAQTSLGSKVLLAPLSFTALSSSTSTSSALMSLQSSSVSASPSSSTSTSSSLMSLPASSVSSSPSASTSLTPTSPGTTTASTQPLVHTPCRPSPTIAAPPNSMRFQGPFEHLNPLLELQRKVKGIREGTRTAQVGRFLQVVEGRRFRLIMARDGTIRIVLLNQ